MSHSPRRRHYSEMFRLGQVPTVEVNALKRNTLAATHLSCNQPNLGRTAPYAPEATFMVSLQLRPCPSHELRCNGRRKPIADYAANTLTIYDLREQWQATLVEPFEVFHFHVPSTALEALRDEHGERRIDRLVCDPAQGCADMGMRQLVNALLPVIDGREIASRLFSEYVMLAMREHVAVRYGGLSAEAALLNGNLAPWQQRRVTDFMLAHLDEDIALADLARECRLSVSYFIRAFKRTLGTTPHQWLTRLRVEAAARLLRSDMPLADIAIECGFVDQSHLTRVFSRHFGLPPGRHRRIEDLGNP